MEYMLMFYETADELAKRQDHRAPAYWAGWTAYVGALYESGVVKSGAGLEPPSMSTTITLVGGKRQVQDGPFADTKELLGGLFFIDVPDLDAALEWAARCPASSTGSVEVRPMLPPPPGV
jgi:hypothetical protein